MKFRIISQNISVGVLTGILWDVQINLKENKTFIKFSLYRWGGLFISLKNFYKVLDFWFLLNECSI